VLRKLRRYDRRTSVLAIGFPSAAYQASADLMIDERLFIEQALGLAADAGEGVPPGGEGPGPHDAGPAAGPAIVADAERAPPVAGDDLLAQIARRIEDAVAHAVTPVAAGPLASRLRQAFAPRLDNWNGHGSFKPFFRSLGLSHLVWINGSGGRIADPQRHAQEVAAASGGPDASAEADARWAGHEALLPVAREVCQLTGAPLLAPPLVRAVLDALCDDLAGQPYEPTETARRVREGCRARGVDVAMRDVVFILRGMQLNGHVFGRSQDDARTLAQRLVNQVLFLCEREQMVLGDAAVAQIRQWIGGDLVH
jgi:hypothetical protein